MKGCITWSWSDGDDDMWAAAEIVADDATYIRARYQQQQAS